MSEALLEETKDYMEEHGLLLVCEYPEHQAALGYDEDRDIYVLIGFTERGMTVRELDDMPQDTIGLEIALS